jgi:hypothetical protein
VKVVAMTKPEQNDPEWTDFQPVLDSEVSIGKFKAARTRAKERVHTKEQLIIKETAKSVPATVRQRS